MLRMTIGPTRIAPSVLAKCALHPAAINDPEFLKTFSECARDLRTLHGIEKGLVHIIPATGTMAMEILAASFAPPRSKVAVFSTGMWGDRWSESCRRMGLDLYRIPVNARGPIDYGALAETVAKEGIKTIFCTQVDSSSGLILDLYEIGRISKKNGAMLLVDGICGAGAEKMDQDGWGVDVLLSSTPKAVGVPCGLVMISTNDRATEFLKTRSWEPWTFALDLKPWVSVMEAHDKGQFGYIQSPAGNLVNALHEGLRLIMSEGIGPRCARHERLRNELHAGLERLGLEILVKDPQYRSNGVTVILYPEGRDPSFIGALLKNGLMLPGGTHPEYGSRTFRIGHFGNVTPEDISTTLSVLEKTLKETAKSAA
jgi:alanine-glyoxylate transaminase/serine-glyoxylate transaminase/serine-pyruvate transaminase